MSSATQYVVLVDISGGFFFSSFNIHTLVALYSRFYFGVSFLGWGWGLACHTTSSGLTQGPGLWSVCRASWPRLCPHLQSLKSLIACLDIPSFKFFPKDFNPFCHFTLKLFSGLFLFTFLFFMTWVISKFF